MNSLKLENETGTWVNLEIEFENGSDLEQLLSMGFKEGIAMGMENLDVLL
ncbi:MAG: hypothetical protein JXR71_09825 [Bacteroidales bacterium]|nr:hypothetical protein [Bacteroidales bacterium]